MSVQPAQHQPSLARPEDLDELQTCLEQADALRRRRDFQQSLKFSERARQIDRNNIHALYLTGWNLVDLGRVAEARPIADRAIALSPGHPQLHWLRGFILLLQGEYEQGWAEYESRWHIDEMGLGKNRYAQPQWRGEDLHGKTILLHPEQGMGDSIQFCRYVELVRQRGPAKVLLATPPELERLFARSMPGIQLVRDREAIPNFDFHCPLMSLPLALRTTLATVPSRVPYLHADEAEVERWRKRLSSHPGRKIGLVWSGGTLSVQNITRSMPLVMMNGLAGIEGVTFVSLQKGPPAEEVAQVPELKLLDWTAEFKDMSDTAALICALDQVITVCTSVSHLSGALARPTWTLLAYAADFRWMLDRSDSPWYPTMRLFRQTALGDWETVIARVRQELEADFNVTRASRPC